MMDDLKIREFKNNIINYMNHVELPLEVKRLVLGEILTETTNLVNTDIKNTLEAMKKEKEESEKEETKTDPENSPE